MRMRKEKEENKSEYKIIRNKHTKGLSCFFEVEGVWYYADLSYCRDVRENEMMIFLATKDKEVVSWSDLYCENFDSVSKENLIAGIENFKSQITLNDALLNDLYTYL